MANRITLEERPRRMACMETKMRYAIMVDGKPFSELYFNMRGYRGSIPSPRPDGTFGSLDIGERPISEYRREIAAANRELTARPAEGR
ncbi:hypothetical protein [Sphingomonas sp. 3-13AW]|uniref:hypothetical protein n=1 Tax=Sphingomonas sp. 3-13AW TaxID=3050450 RepID=UPI003BB6652F